MHFLARRLQQNDYCAIICNKTINIGTSFYRSTNETKQLLECAVLGTNGNEEIGRSLNKNIMEQLKNNLLKHRNKHLLADILDNCSRNYQ